MSQIVYFNPQYFHDPYWGLQYWHERTIRPPSDLPRMVSGGPVSVWEDPKAKRKKRRKKALKTLDLSAVSPPPTAIEAAMAQRAKRQSDDEDELALFLALLDD